MKKYLTKLVSWIKSILKKEEIIEKEIPVDVAFRMWKEEQRKKK